MRPHGFPRAGLVVLASLFFAASADAQILWRWFGPKTADKTPAAKSAQPDPRRAAEINVEVAWLADPVTFPYYLEARVTDAKLEVRGYVPNKTVRERALRIAQVYSSLPVTDSMREHPSLFVKSSQMSGEQLHKSVVSSLRVALPKQYQTLKVECGADGKVFVIGVVTTHEEKMAVSNSLRRLHGCTSVQNLTSLPDELAQSLPRDKTPIVKVSKSADLATEKPVVVQENKSRFWLPWPFNKAKTPTDEPPLLDPRKPALVDAKKPTPADGPVLIPNLPELKSPAVKKESIEPPPSKAPLTAGELQKRIQAAWPKAKSVEVQFAANKEVRITLELRAESEVSPAAERVFALPELQNYRPELQFKIASP